jgi:hypothetical protein
MEKDSNVSWERSPDIIGPPPEPVNPVEEPESVEDTGQTPDDGAWKRSPEIRPPDPSEVDK